MLHQMLLINIVARVMFIRSTKGEASRPYATQTNFIGQEVSTIKSNCTRTLILTRPHELYSMNCAGTKKLNLRYKSSREKRFLSTPY